MDVSALSYPVLQNELYRKKIKALQLELMHLQLWVYRHQHRVVLVMEGPDAAGKGGIIRRAVRYMDPRSVRVHSIGAPNATEQAQHYLQRFWARLPKKGQMAVFDRSWYGRVLVERVEEALPNYAQYYEEICHFEKMLMDDGVVVVKILLYIDHKEQRQRLISRLESPEKCWKLTESDLRSHGFYREYQQAYNDMLANTGSVVPWHVIAANDKQHARVTAQEILLDRCRERLGEPADDHHSAEFIEKARKILKQDVQ